VRIDLLGLDAGCLKRIRPTGAELLKTDVAWERIEASSPNPAGPSPQRLTIHRRRIPKPLHPIFKLIFGEQQGIIGIIAP
jgi:hypothetical protein